MKDDSPEALPKHAATGGLFTAKIVKKGRTTASPRLIAANKRTKERLAEARPDMHVMAM